MIDSRLLYKIYIEVINLRINDLLEESLSYHTIHNNLIKRLYEYRPYINLCSNYSVTEILEFTELRQFNKIYFKTDDIWINNINYKKNILELYLRNYIEINKIIVKNEIKVDNLKNQRLDYSTYNTILKKFNRKIMDAMIYEGYIFNPGYAFGKLFISKEVSDTPRVNIGASMVKKKELLAEGREPYCKEEEDKCKEKGIPYNGVKYFVYYPNIDFMVRWVRSKELRKWFPFVTEFKYKPAANKKYSFLSRMRDFIKEDRQRALILYDRDYERA